MLLPLKKLAELIGYSHSAIYAKCNPKSKFYDPAFPKPIKVGVKTRFVLEEIEAWVEARKAEREART